ncbi:hypothetical protein [Brevundimonas sp.]|uniref:hypothetical protein n=1 Tax=Brevundimonas sp. TaxID=1871086 RepID=UPI001A32C482|nr:hypothetical protein [Brevundimonas sp.]MBJ7483660.1 hypothetical protein [Brevundimonas sp.]
MKQMAKTVIWIVDSARLSNGPGCASLCPAVVLVVKTHLPRVALNGNLVTSFWHIVDQMQAMDCQMVDNMQIGDCRPWNG